ncbi:hypothetical protein [Candidatus Hamiltonella endosymbiont of Tuberolachnus salignus]
MPQISLIDQKGFHNKENLPETFKEVTKNTSPKNTPPTLHASSSSETS